MKLSDSIFYYKIEKLGDLKKINRIEFQFIMLFL